MAQFCIILWRLDGFLILILFFKWNDKLYDFFVNVFLVEFLMIFARLLNDAKKILINDLKLELRDFRD